MKPLLPTLREKKRYVVFEAISASALMSHAVYESILDSARKLLGELQGAMAAIQPLDFWKKQKGVLRVNRKYVNHAKAALALVRDVQGIPVVLRSVGVSGTLKKAESKFMN